MPARLIAVSSILLLIARDDGTVEESSGCCSSRGTAAFVAPSNSLDKLTAHATRKLILNCLINELQFAGQ